MSNSRIQEVQRDIDETKGVMADNIDMMIKNQEKAEILQDKTESLAHNANAFQKNSNQLKKTMWWKNVKLMLIIGAIIAIVVIVIIVIIVLAVK